MAKGRRASTAEFWTLVQRGHITECWPFTGSRGGGGMRYGYYAGVGAHRYAFQVHYGLQVPSRLVVRHDCDNPLCCNPRHLRIGTTQENALDASIRGRRSAAKLDADKVRAIRSAPPEVASTALAERYGISPALVSMVRAGRRWTHVPDAPGGAR